MCVEAAGGGRHKTGGSAQPKTRTPHDVGEKFAHTLPLLLPFLSPVCSDTQSLHSFSQVKSEWMPQWMSQKMPHGMPERMSEHKPKSIPKNICHVANCTSPVQFVIPPAFDLACILTFDLAFLTYVLTFYVDFFSFYLTYILTSCPPLYLAFSLACVRVQPCLTMSAHCQSVT